MLLQLFHTSSESELKINKLGLFGSFICFSGHVYSMGSTEYNVFELEISGDEIIDASQLFYHENAAVLDALVEKFAARFSLSIDDAEEIISERAQLDSGDEDDAYHVQHTTCQAAKLLGFRGVRGRDEQGAVYMIDMFGRESELKRLGRMFEVTLDGRRRDADD